jgi:hypothetical protein
MAIRTVDILPLPTGNVKRCRVYVYQTPGKMFFFGHLPDWWGVPLQATQKSEGRSKAHGSFSRQARIGATTARGVCDWFTPPPTCVGPSFWPHATRGWLRANATRRLGADSAGGHAHHHARPRVTRLKSGRCVRMRGCGGIQILRGRVRPRVTRTAGRWR